MDNYLCNFSFLPVRDNALEFMGFLAGDYGKMLLDGLKEMQEQGIFTDITLVLGDMRIKAHKVILCAISPYFKAMLSAGMRESQLEEISLREIKGNIMQKIIEFAYTGKIDCTAEDVQDILMAADFLDVNLLRVQCLKYIAANVDEQNCGDVYALGLHIGQKKLCKFALNYLLNNFVEISKTDEFYNVSVEMLTECLKLEELKYVMKGMVPIPAKQEERILSAVLRYVAHKKDEYLPELPKLMELVRMPVLLTSDMNCLKDHPLLKESEECLVLLNKALDKRKECLREAECDMESCGPGGKQDSMLYLDKLFDTECGDNEEEAVNKEQDHDENKDPEEKIEHDNDENKDPEEKIEHDNDEKENKDPEEKSDSIPHLSNWHEARANFSVTTTYSAEYAGRDPPGVFCDHYDDNFGFSSTPGYVTGMKIYPRLYDGRLVWGGYEVTYNSGKKIHHGGKDYGEAVHEFTLDDGEVIVCLEVNSSEMIDQITFHTSKDRVFGPYGGTEHGRRRSSSHGVQDKQGGFLMSTRGQVVRTGGEMAIVALSFQWGHASYPGIVMAPMMFDASSDEEYDPYEDYLDDGYMDFFEDDDDDDDEDDFEGFEDNYNF